MRKALFGLLCGMAAFVIGVLTVSMGLTPETERRLNVDFGQYRVTVNELIDDRRLFDGKVVQVRGNFEKMREANIGNFGGYLGWIRVTCSADPRSCEKLFGADRRDPFFYDNDDDRRVEVVGRFTSEATDPHPLQRGAKVMLLDVTSVLSVPLVHPETPVGDGVPEKRQRIEKRFPKIYSPWGQPTGTGN